MELFARNKAGKTESASQAGKLEADIAAVLGRYEKEDQMYLRFAVILFILILFSSCSSEPEEPEPQAEVELISWKQDCNVTMVGSRAEYEWGQTEIRFRITNVGETDIDWYFIRFAMRYYVYYVSDVTAEGENLGLRKGETREFCIYVEPYQGRQLISVEIEVFVASKLYG